MPLERLKGAVFHLPDGRTDTYSYGSVSQRQDETGSNQRRCRTLQGRQERAGRRQVAALPAGRLPTPHGFQILGGDFRGRNEPVVPFFNHPDFVINNS